MSRSCAGTTLIGKKCTRKLSYGYYCHTHLYQSVVHKQNISSNVFVFPLENATYFGKIINNKREGFAEYESENFIYKGYWKNDLPNGTGCLSFLKESYRGLLEYEGEFKNGTLCASKDAKLTLCVKKHSDIKKIIYQGETNDKGRRNGKGLTKVYYTSEKISVMDGTFVNGDLTGHTIFTLDNKVHYIGDMKNYKRHGYGECTGLSGEIYKGNFKHDKRHGNGEIIYDKDNSIFVGEFKDDKKNGIGVLTDKNKKIIKKGNWKNDIYVDIELAKTDESACKICLEYEANMMLLPCLHFGFCQNCADQLEICAFCRSVIKEKVKPIKI